MSNAGARAISPWWAAGLAAVVTLVGLAVVTDAYGSVAAPTPTPSTSPGPVSSTPNTSPFPPTAPTGLVVSAVTSGSVTLSWTASGSGCCGVQGYDITMTQAFNDIVWTVSVGNVTTTTVTANVRPTGQYSFRVSAHDDLGHRSGSSNAVTTVTPASDTALDKAPPSTPGNLVLTGTGPGGAALTWSPSTDNVGVTGYDVYQFDGLYISTLLATVPTTAYTAPLTSPRNVFYVRARDAGGNLSIVSNTVVVTGSTTTPPPPTPTCRVTYAVTSQWQGGFVANVTIANVGATPVNGWTLGFSFGGDQRITQSWNAGFSQSGAAVTLRDAGWNKTVPAGGSTSLGVLGTWAASFAPPAAYTLNGASCTVA